MGRIIRNLMVLLVVAGIGAGAYGYFQAFTNNIPSDKDGYALLIPEHAGFDFVMAELQANNILKNASSFRQVAQLRSYDKLVKPGRYILKSGTNNWKLVEKLRAGAQDEMKLRFRTHWKLEETAAEIGDQLMIGKDELLAKMKDNQFLKEYGVNQSNVQNLLIPNTYFVYWTMSPKELFNKLKKSYDDFWNADRVAKAKTLGLTRAEVTTLASIVQAETYMTDERPRVAGLYLNRIRDGIPLQADPTVIFANQDFTIKRVLKSHLEFDSPYNTYKYRGLPPGPINNPEPSAIDGVLNFEDHKYYYMCAKEDFSGYHNFASSLSQHNRNAKAYQKAYREMMKKKAAQQ